MKIQSKYISSSALASRLGLPRVWIVREAKNGSLPHIKAGRRLLFDPDAVEQALLEISARNEASNGD